MANALGSGSEWNNALFLQIGLAYGLAMWNARNEWADTTPVQYAIVWFTWALTSYSVDGVGMNAASSAARILWASIRDSDAIVWTLLETKVVVPLMGAEKVTHLFSLVL